MRNMQTPELLYCRARSLWICGDTCEALDTQSSWFLFDSWCVSDKYDQVPWAWMGVFVNLQCELCRNGPVKVYNFQIYTIFEKWWRCGGNNIEHLDYFAFHHHDHVCDS